MAKLSVLTALLGLLCAGVVGHPKTAEGKRAMLEAHGLVAAHSRRALGRCADSAEAVALGERAVARRAAQADALRRERGIKTPLVRRAERSAFDKWAAVSHDASSRGYGLDTPMGSLFGCNTSAALVPETIIGPYFVEGERIRSDLADGQAGVRVHLDYQFIDINTCRPVPGLLVDVWHANATGVYSGVTARGQGGLRTTHGRGVQRTDDDGVVQFDTVFPGHYAGRTNHFHVMSTGGATVLPNGTYQGGTAQHIGQTYFDDDLIRAVEAVEPYSRNKQPHMSNADDDFTADEATADADPFMNYVYLGESPADGLLMWMAIGIDPDADYNDKKHAAAHWYPKGGVDLSHRRHRSG
ncbi:hypothetical protein CDD83_11235 [Cordyceps sp. RAO-2017]|nr:hypothetical protein CDD83_11235 [Cordyceps sp. RAO-2017]